MHTHTHAHIHKHTHTRHTDNMCKPTHFFFQYIAVPLSSSFGFWGGDDRLEIAQGCRSYTRYYYVMHT